MRILLQRVTHASVTVDEEIIGKIDEGLLAFIGIGPRDDAIVVRRMMEKVARLRIFSDEAGKVNRSINDIAGGILLISQFTLYADCTHGNRPSFTDAAPPSLARELYEMAVADAREIFSTVAQGSFGADMKIDLCNDGPFTVYLDSDTCLR